MTGKEKKVTTMSVPAQAEFIQMLEHFPQLVYWKDIKNGCFLGGNQKFADFLGVDSIENIIGNDGYAFLDAAIVDAFRKYEKQVIISGEEVEIVEELYHPKTGETVANAVMAPIFNDSGEITSIICYGSEQIRLADKSWTQALQLINKKNMPKLIKENKYFVDSEHGRVILSKKEAECALYILKGLRSKQIAKEMGVAPRTVEYHVENIRNKFNCDLRGDLIAKLTNGNFIENF